MKVYYFTSQEWGLKNIERRSVKISRIEDLNDPFELLSVELKAKKHREAFSRWRSEISNKFGMICLSEDWSNPVMWSHYADKHRGMCLEFEVQDHLLIPVTYALERLPNRLVSDLGSGYPESEADMKKLLATKFKHWEYEKEHRLFVSLEQPDQDGLYYKEFDASLNLIGAILGPRSDLSRAELSKAFQKGRYQQEPYSFKARLAFESFSVVRNKDGAVWQ